jgi:hypothetical protein
MCRLTRDFSDLFQFYGIYVQIVIGTTEKNPKQPLFALIKLGVRLFKHKKGKTEAL